MTAEPGSLRRRIQGTLREWEGQKARLLAASDDQQIPAVLQRACLRAAEDLAERMEELEAALCG